MSTRKRGLFLTLLLVAMLVTTLVGAVSAQAAGRVSATVGNVNLIVDTDTDTPGIQTDEIEVLAVNDTFTVEVWAVTENDQQYSVAESFLSYDTSCLSATATGKNEYKYTIKTDDNLGIGTSFVMQIETKTLRDDWDLSPITGGTIRFGRDCTAKAGSILAGSSMEVDTDVSENTYTIQSGDLLKADSVVKGFMSGTVSGSSFSLVTLKYGAVRFGYPTIFNGSSQVGSSAMTDGTYNDGTLLPNTADSGIDTENGIAYYSTGSVANEAYPSTAIPVCYIDFTATAISEAEGTSLTFLNEGDYISACYVVDRDEVGEPSINLTDALTGTTLDIQSTPDVSITMDPANGTVTAGNTVTLTGTLAAGTGPAETWEWDFDGNDEYNDGDTQEVTFDKTTAGTYTVKVKATNTVGNDTATETVIINTGAAYQLVFGTQPPDSVTAGDTISAFTVEIQDQYGNLIDDDSTQISVEVTGDGEFASGTETQTATDGEATFNDLTITDADTYTITATATGLQNAVSDQITVDPATASQLVFDVQPEAAESATVDDAFATQPVLEIQDEYGNVTSDTTTVVLTDLKASDDTTDGDGTLTGTTSVSAVDGIATFSGIGYTTTDTIHIGAAAGELTAVSTTGITLGVGADDHLAFSAQPASPVTAGATWEEFIVNIEDQYNNLTASTAEITVAPSSESFTDGTTTIAATSGSVTFYDLQMTAAGTYTVTASATGIDSATSDSVIVDPDVADSMDFTTQPAAAETDATVDDTFETQPVLTLYDQYNNVVTNDDSTTVTLTDVLASDDSTDGEGSLYGDVDITVTAGVATFTDVGYTKLDTIHIKATADVLEIVSTIDITLGAGAPAALVIDEINSPVTAGDTWTSFGVTINDQYGNQTDSEADVTVELDSGSFASGTETQGATAGVATFNDLVVNVTGIYTLTASMTGDITSDPSNDVAVEPAAANHVNVTPTNPEVTITTDQQFEAEVQDEFDNPIPDATITWSVLNADAGSINATSGLFTASSNIADYTDVIKASVDGTDPEIYGTASIQVIGAEATVTATLQGGERPLEGFDVSLVMKLYNQVTSRTDIMDGTATADFTFTTDDGNIVITDSNTSTEQITFTISDLPQGYYHITLVSTSTLENVRWFETIGLSDNTFDMGTLIGGNADGSGKIDGSDFAMILNDYWEGDGDSSWNDGRCDFDGDGQVTGLDYSIMAMNYNSTDPVELNEYEL